MREVGSFGIYGIASKKNWGQARGAAGESFKSGAKPNSIDVAAEEL